MHKSDTLDIEDKAEIKSKIKELKSDIKEARQEAKDNDANPPGAKGGPGASPNRRGKN